MIDNSEVVKYTSINRSNKTFFIAELGVNHEGSMDTCKLMISEAKKTGADAVKIQTFNPNEHYRSNTESYKIFKDCMFSYNEIEELLS